MMRRLVVLTDPMTPDQERLLQQFCAEKQWGYWHWMSGSWLMDAPSSYADPCVTVRDEIIRIVGPQGLRCLAFEIKGNIGSRWAGFGPQEPDKHMFQHLVANWFPDRLPVP